MGRPDEAALFFDEPDHVATVTNVIDLAVGCDFFAERLIDAVDHRPIDGPRKEAHPMARMLALNLHAEKIVAFFAGNEQQIVVGPPAAFVEHGFHFGQAERAGVFGMAVAVKLALMNEIDAELLHDADVFRRFLPLDALLLLFQGMHGGGHVVVAGEGFVAGEFDEAIAVGQFSASR